MRADWFRVMRPLGAWVPWELRDLIAEADLQVGLRQDDSAARPGYWGEGVLRQAPQLRDEHLRNCVVVPTRSALLHRLAKGGIVAEVGVLHGEFSREILSIVDPGELHLIDHHIEPGARALAEGDTQGRVRLHHGDSHRVLDAFPDGYFDWIYIDAQHTYEGVARDIRAARRAVKEHGTLVFNDYTPWSYVEMQPYGVVAAVNELCLDEEWEIVCLALPAHMYCDVAVRRRIPASAGGAGDASTATA
jgi:predicted O-methyltransferase YrrM